VKRLAFAYDNNLQQDDYNNDKHVVQLCIYTVSQKNDSDVAQYNFNAHQPILVIFGRDIAERICY